MKLTELLTDELEREAALSRRVLERVPEGKNDWKPHAKSMRLGYLAVLVASMPGWIDLMINQDELSFDSPGRNRPDEVSSNTALVGVLDSNLTKARAALSGTNDEHLMTPWRIRAGGRVVQEQARHLFLRDAVFSHMAHHRGQLTVYLRLNDAAVPAIYGPSADEGGF